MNIGRFSVRNPVLINILMVSILLIGLITFMKMPRQLNTDISFNWVIIAVPYPGASAEEVEKNITIKIEDEISDVDNIKKITSESKDGVATIQVEFDDELNDDEFRRVYQDLRVEYDKVVLPEGTMDPYIDAFSSADFFPLINIVLRSDDEHKEILNEYAIDLQDKVKEITDISKADLVGNEEKEIWIEVDRNKLESYGISIETVANMIKYQNMNIPGGIVKTAKQNYILSTEGEVKAKKEFGEVIVKNVPGQGIVKVKDFSSINSGFAESDYDARFNGEKSIQILVSKTAKGNSLKVVDEVRVVVEKFSKTAPKEIEVSLSNDTTYYIRDILEILGSNSIMGFVLLIVVLFLFLGLRSSVITALGIPMAFAITFIIMSYLGETLNGSSTFALVLVLGMIVDHAIVIIENSYRYREMGLSMEEAAEKGTNEVILPVIAATGTTVAAFLPLMILPGLLGKFMRVIPLVVTIALVASTVEAFIFLPSHFAEYGESKPNFLQRTIALFDSILLKLKASYKNIHFISSVIVFPFYFLATVIVRAARAKAKIIYFLLSPLLNFLEKRSEKKKLKDSKFTKFQEIFEKIMIVLYSHRYKTLIVTLIVILSSGVLMNFVEKNLFDGDTFSNFKVNIKLPQGTSRSVTSDIVKRYEDALIPKIGKNFEIKAISSTVGLLQTSSDWLQESNVGQITVVLYEKKEGRKKGVEEVLKEVEKLCKNISGAEVVTYEIQKGGPPVSKPINFRLQGDNLEDMDKISESYKGMLKTYSELYNIDDNFNKAIPELIVKVDRQKAASYGLSPAQVGLFIRAAFDGVVATTYYEDDTEIDVVVKYNDTFTTSAQQVESMKIPSPSGAMIPFNSFCSLERSSGIASIKRIDKRREITVSADTYDKSIIDVLNKRIQKEWDDKYSKIYPNVSLNMTGEFAEFQNLLGQILQLFVVGIFLIYVILGAQFKSYFQPLIMILTIPFAFTGCVLYLFLSGTPISIVVLYAGVALAGIAVNDAIVLISFINQMRKEGVETSTAIVKGAVMRLRPIILTSVTTIGGLLPMALGIGGESSTWAPMASTIIFGLFFSTVGTLVVIPSVYGILNDITELLGSHMQLEGE